MKLIKCPEVFEGYSRSLFIAGGISGCSDWQNEFVSMFWDKDIVLINPRRDNYDFDDPSLEEKQISWEFDHLQKSDAVSFWFPNETLCPITLYELGKISNSDKKLFIGVDPDYSRKNDVIIQTSLIRPDVEVVFSLEKLIDQVKEWLK